ncbi:MAG: hypothetical protein M0P01_02095 [Treponema sp.]|nr:hypothetical protein [Treponema sp.]
MKAIIISDDDDVIKKVNNTLIAHNFDTIIYRWLLKALDNVEEIRPDVVVISTSDYPRHWKTFSQFVKCGISGNIPQIILYTPDFFPVTEVEKAAALRIKGTFSSLDKSGLEKFVSILKSKTSNLIPETEENTIIIEQSENKIYNLIFTHPKTEAFITGIVLTYKNDQIEFKPDIMPLVQGLTAGDHIQEVSFRNNNKYSYCTADIVSTGEIIVLRLGKIYEN